MRRALLLVLALALVVPAAAPAATVRLGAGGTVEVTAGPGEVNVIAVRAPTPGEVAVADTGTPPVAASGCRAVSPEEVRCAAPAGARVVVDAGDGPDLLESDGVGAVLHGGDGADRLIGDAARGSSCGEGRADLFQPANAPAIPRLLDGCERVRLSPWIVLSRVRPAGRRHVKLSAFLTRPRLALDLVLRAGDRTLAHRRVRLRGAGRSGFRVRVGRRERLLLRDADEIRLIVRRRGRLPVGFRQR